VAVSIADVKIIDPFEGDETVAVRRLRVQLDAAKEDLERERADKARLERSVVELERAVAAERAAARASAREAYRQTVLALRAFAPYAPLTEALLGKVNPPAPSAAVLNELFGLKLETVQQHIDHIVNEARYAELVEAKYIRGLSDAETSEMARLAEELSTLDESFYAPVFELLKTYRAHSEDSE
jgi:hypothetical protein